MPTFGENLKELRKSRGYTQDKFARAIGSNQVNVSAWEIGTRIPALATIRHIADVFKVPVSSLISIENTGLEDDYIQQVGDILRGNDKMRLLVDKAKYLSESDLDVVIGVINAITKGRPE